MFKDLYNHLAKPINLMVVNMIVVNILIWINNEWQVLCRPTLWATISLAISFLSTIIYPVVKPEAKVAKYLFAFLNGIATMTYLYFILFMAGVFGLGVLLIIIGIGLFTFIPHFLFIQLIKNYVWKQKDKVMKRYFLTGVCLSLIFAFTSSIYYHRETQKLKTDLADNKIEPSFVNEKILGMHFIYHTKYCWFDGWRPPIHEPTLILWLWTGGEDFITSDLDERITLYQSVFPENEVKKECSCASDYKNVYHKDSLWVRHAQASPDKE